MLIKVFSVWDSKCSTFRYPFFMQNTGQAVRAFSNLVNDGKSEVSQYPGDFTLFEHGCFDDQDGKIIPLDAAINLGIGVKFKVDVKEGK